MTPKDIITMIDSYCDHGTNNRPTLMGIPANNDFAHGGAQAWEYLRGHYSSEFNRALFHPAPIVVFSAGSTVVNAVKTMRFAKLRQAQSDIGELLDRLIRNKKQVYGFTYSPFALVHNIGPRLSFFVAWLVNRSLRSVYENYGVKIIPLEKETGPGHYNKNDIHLNQAGNRSVAKVVARYTKVA